MKFLLFEADSRTVTRGKADSIASTVHPVSDTGWHFADADAQIELVTPRLWGWMRWLLPDRREWVTPISSDDAYPLRFEQPDYRIARPWNVLQENEAEAHQNTYDVAMTQIQQRSGYSFWNLPLTVMVILVSVAFLAMILAWIYLGAFG